MRRAAFACLILASLASATEPAQRSAIILFGPASAETARQTVKIAVAMTRTWLSQAGSSAELRRAGIVDGFGLDAATPAKQMETPFLTAAHQARDTDPEAFLRSLDRAAQVLAGRPGLRLLVTIVDEQPLSTEGEAQLKQTIDFCQTNSIRVIVLDPSEVASKRATSSLKALGEATGGALIRDPKALESTVLLASSGSKTSDTAYDAPSAEKPVVAANLPAMPTDLPVHTRFVRISPRNAESFGVQRSVGAGQGGISTTDTGINMEDTTGPIRGWFLVESPNSALQFDVDDNAGTYTARARLTQMARNAAGKIVWQASKPITMHGPLKKLETRKAGNMYYLREVVLPHGDYTLEATVEDLTANKTGGVREPLRTGRSAPGFTVSDALIVRPLNGAGDKFEADQILNYDGNAIAPLLDPVYQANQPFTLQIFLTIYPDMYGAKPELSMELLRNGRVVGRSALPFTDKLRNDAAEASGMASIVSEQKHEFPYMATLRGVQLGAGEYEARVTVRQGSNALTRVVNFSVAGADGRVAVASAGPAASAPDDDAEVTLPDVDPVHLAADGLVLAAPEQQKLWEEAAANALSYTSRLPNFRCNRETKRLTAPVRSAESFHETDSIIEELTYERPKETYRTIEVNGLKSSSPRESIKGVQTRGEFGAMLKSIFEPQVGAQYKWAGRAMTAGVLCDVFDVDVSPMRSNFVLRFNLRQEVAGFHGRVFVDEDAGMVRRIVLEGKGLPKDFALQSPTFSLEYGMVRVAGEDRLLPLRSVLQVRQGRQVVRNETQFRDYRKFDASSEIKF